MPRMRQGDFFSRYGLSVLRRSASTSRGAAGESFSQCPALRSPHHLHSPKRRVGPLLGIGIFLLPLVFAWFTLRYGHSTVSRIVSFGWLGIVVLLKLAALALLS